MHQVRGKGGSAFLVVRQDTASTVQAVHFKDKENPEDSKRWAFPRVADHVGWVHGVTAEPCRDAVRDGASFGFIVAMRESRRGRNVLGADQTMTLQLTRNVCVVRHHFHCRA